MPKGVGALKVLDLRPWQVELIEKILDGEPRPRIAGIMMSRGSGKTTLLAALAVYELMTGPEGASIVVAAVDQRQAELCFRTASRMVELHPALASRVQVFRERLEVPTKGATFVAYPAEAKRLEGLDYTLAIIDELGVVARDTVETILLAQGKRPESCVIGIGTPSSDTDSVLLDWRAHGHDNPGDPSFVWVEYSAAGFEHHPVDCRHCWELACPALGDFAAEDAMRALLPPKTREASFRRSRLCQIIPENTEPVLPPGLWDSLSTGEGIAHGSDVVLAFDGSYSGTDATVILAATISPTPHLDIVALWARPTDADDTYRVPILEVEQAIRDACKRYRVREIACDPYRFQRSMEVLSAEGFPIAEFPQTVSRMATATTQFLTACTNGQLSHSGNPVLASHLGNAVLSEDSRGARMVKPSRSRHAGRIDAGICAVMGHARATHYATRPRPRYASFRG